MYTIYGAYYAPKMNIEYILFSRRKKEQSCMH